MTDVWLVHITVNKECRRVQKRGKLNGHALHQDLMRLAPHDLGESPRQQAGLLYRAEHTNQGLQVLAQLASEPHIGRLAEDFATQVQQRHLTPLLDKLSAGMRVRYRIDANATKRHLANKEKRGKLANLHGTEADLWWLRKSGEAGLHPLQLNSTPLNDTTGQPSDRQHPKTSKPEEALKTAQHGVTRFEGFGIVTDPDKLREAVKSGIGRARTYGCGLLSLGLTQETA